MPYKVLDPTGVIQRIARSGEFYAKVSMDGESFFITGANTATWEIFSEENMVGSLVMVPVVPYESLVENISRMALFGYDKVVLEDEGYSFDVSRTGHEYTIVMGNSNKSTSFGITVKVDDLCCIESVFDELKASLKDAERTFK